MDLFPDHPDLGPDYHILVLQETHSDLNLSREQAVNLVEKLRVTERVSASAFSADRVSLLPEFYLCTFEEFDYQRSVYEKVLTAEQFSTFTSFFDENYQRHIDWVAANDVEAIAQIAFREKLIANARETLLPALSALELFAGIATTEFQTKRLRLQEAYNNICDQLLLRNLRDHFRECRSHAPNGMRLLELEDENLRLVPSFPLVREFLSVELVSLADSLLEQLATSLSIENAAKISTAFKAYGEFSTARMEELYASTPPAAMYVINETVDVAAMYRGQLISVLLQGEVG